MEACNGYLAVDLVLAVDGIVAQGFGFDGSVISGGCTQHEDTWVVEVHLDGHFLHVDHSTWVVEVHLDGHILHGDQ